MVFNADQQHPPIITENSSLLKAKKIQEALPLTILQVHLHLNNIRVIENRTNSNAREDL